MLLFLKDVSSHFIKIVWNFYEMFVDPKYVFVSICRIIWQNLGIITIIRWITIE